MFFSSPRKKHTNYQCFRKLLTQNTIKYIVLITRGSPRRLFMHMRDTWWWWAVLYIIKQLFLLRVVLGFYPSPLGWHCRADIRTLNFLHCLMSIFFCLPVNNAKICATCESLAYVIEPAPFEPWEPIREDSRRNVSSVVRLLQNNWKTIKRQLWDNV